MGILIEKYIKKIRLVYTSLFLDYFIPSSMPIDENDEDEISNLKDLRQFDWLNHGVLSPLIPIHQAEEPHVTAQAEEPHVHVPAADIHYDVCIFHAPCNDGTAAAYAVHRRFENCKFFGANRGSGDTDIGISDWRDELVGKNIVLVDFVLEREDMIDLMAISKNVLVIDHHQSEFEMLTVDLGMEIGKNLIFSNACSACILTWKFFLPSIPIPTLVQYIDDCDTASFVLPNTGALIGGMAVQSPILKPGWHMPSDGGGLKFFREFHYAINAGNQYIRTCIVMGMIAREIEWRDIYSDAQRCVEKRFRKFPNFLCRIVNVSPNARNGALTRALLEGHESYPCDIAILYFRIDVNDSYKISLRSNREDVNVGLVASEYGGGGHVNAGSITWYGQIDDPSLFLTHQEKIDYEWNSRLRNVLLFKTDIERVVDLILQWEPRHDKSRLDVISEIRNGGKYALSELEIEVLEYAASCCNYRTLEIATEFNWRGIPFASSNDNCTIHGIGLTSEGEIVLFQNQPDSQDVLVSGKPIIRSQIWTLVETEYENYFYDCGSGHFKYADSLEDVSVDFLRELESAGKVFRPIQIRRSE